MKKLGLKAQDTSELFFKNVRIPVSNLIGEEHRGFEYLTINLAHERLVQAVRSAAVAEVTIEQTVDYVVQRVAFGQAIPEFQNTQFKLAELKAETVAGRVFVDRCVELQLKGKLGQADARIAKIAGGTMEVMKQIIARDLFREAKGNRKRKTA